MNDMNTLDLYRFWIDFRLDQNWISIQCRKIQRHLFPIHCRAVQQTFPVITAVRTQNRTAANVRYSQLLHDKLSYTIQNAEAECEAADFFALRSRRERATPRNWVINNTNRRFTGECERGGRQATEVLPGRPNWGAHISMLPVCGTRTKTHTRVCGVCGFRHWSEGSSSLSHMHTCAAPQCSSCACAFVCVKSGTLMAMSLHILTVRNA